MFLSTSMCANLRPEHGLSLEKIKKANKPRDSVNYKLVTAG